MFKTIHFYCVFFLYNYQMKRVSGIHSLLTITIWLVSLSVLPRSTFTFSLTSVLRCFQRSISKMSTWHCSHRFSPIALSIHVSVRLIAKVCPLRPFWPRCPYSDVYNKNKGFSKNWLQLYNKSQWSWKDDFTSVLTPLIPFCIFHVNFGSCWIFLVTI